MRHITNNNIIIELTKDELNELIMLCFDGSNWNNEHGFPTLGHSAHQMAMRLWEIRKELDK